MKNIAIILALLLCAPKGHALFIINECDNDTDIKAFEKLYKIRVDEHELEEKQVAYSWIIKFPAEYKKYKYDYIQLSLEKDNKELLHTYLETNEAHRDKGYLDSYIGINREYDADIKMYIQYNEHPRSAMDGAVCKFIIIKKHNKSFKSGTPQSGAP